MKFLIGAMLTLLILFFSTQDVLANSYCEDFKASLNHKGHMSYGYVSLPLNWAQPEGEQLPVFWWKRAGSNPAKPPLLLLHGGPGGNSWWFEGSFPRIFSEYPGDIFVVDERGDGCSALEVHNLPYEKYEVFQSREIVKDLEALRLKFYPGQKWRAFGQSHGSMILHYYLEMHPEGLESVHAHGFAYLFGDQMKRYSAIRDQGMRKSVAQFLKDYPRATADIKAIRASMTANDCWFTPVPHSALGKLCGPSVLDMITANLAFRDYWSTVAQDLAKLINPDGSVNILARDKFINWQLTWAIDINFFNLVIGSFAQDVAFPDFDIMTQINQDPTLPILSETRFFVEAVFPRAPQSWSTNIDVPDFEKIKNFLSTNPNFNFYLYSGDWDSIAPPSLYVDEVQFLGPLVKYTNFPNSGHDGNSTEPLIQEHMLAN